MRSLPIAALVLLVCLPAAGASFSSHSHRKMTGKKAHSHQSLHAASARSVSSKHTRLERPSASEQHASFHTANYRPSAAARPDVQTSGSSAKSASAAKKKKSTRKKKTARRAPAQMNPTADRVSDIQSALARGGYYKADPNGKWDADTVEALQRFQAANGLDSTGKLDALTLQKLGLGSDVAGVSAPKGIVPHSCCSMTASPSLAPPHAAPTSTTAAPSGASLPSAPSASASSAVNEPAADPVDSVAH